MQYALGAPDCEHDATDAEKIESGSKYLETSAAWERFILAVTTHKNKKGQEKSDVNTLKFVDPALFKAKTVANKKGRKQEEDGAGGVNDQGRTMFDDESKNNNLVFALKNDPDVVTHVINFVVTRINFADTLISDKNQGKGEKAEEKKTIVLNNVLEFAVPIIQYFTKVKDSFGTMGTENDGVDVDEVMEGASSLGKMSAASNKGVDCGKVLSSTVFSSTYKPVCKSYVVQALVYHGKAQAFVADSRDNPAFVIKLGIIDLPRGVFGQPYDTPWEKPAETVRSTVYVLCYMYCMYLYSCFCFV